MLKNPTSKMLHIARSIVNECGGNIGVIAALSAVPLIVTIGMAVDYDRMSRARMEVQEALDAATLASAANGQLDYTLSTSV